MAIAITQSSELAINVGNEVITPTGYTFRIDLWQTAKQHGLDTATSAFGSRMQITTAEGNVREFFNNKYKGSERLTDFYNEVGLKTSGKSGSKGPKRPFGQQLEDAYMSAKEPNKTEIVLNFLISLDNCPVWLKRAQEAEAERVKEEQKKAEEERNRQAAIKALITQGFTKKEAENILNSKKQKK